jgi:SAM-dependent methyltransferase
VKEWHLLAGFHHAILHEAERERAFGYIDAFLDAGSGQASDPTVADRSSHTQREFEELRAPLSPLSARGVATALQRLALTTVGRVSRGIAIGLETGFDSGPMLDYVYENHSEGVSVVGKLLDRLYLNTPGWRGIRHRCEDIKAVLRREIEKRCDPAKELHIVDIACGGARYVLEVVAEFPSQPIAVTLRDHRPESLAAARELAAQLGLTTVRFLQADAFDGASLAELPPADIVVASGIFELVAENQPVLASLTGVSALLKKSGTLIYTNQPWHPQIESIARVLHDSEGRRWVMRRRSQLEMDTLVGRAGMAKYETRLDPQGIFSVSCAAPSGK